MRVRYGSGCSGEPVWGDGFVTCRVQRHISVRGGWQDGDEDGQTDRREDTAEETQLTSRRLIFQHFFFFSSDLFALMGVAAGVSGARWAWRGESLSGCRLPTHPPFKRSSKDQ